MQVQNNQNTLPIFTDEIGNFIRANFSSLYLKRYLILPVKLKEGDNKEKEGDYLFIVTEETRADAINDCLMKLKIKNTDRVSTANLNKEDLINLINSVYELSMDSSKEVANEVSAKDSYNNLKSFESIDIIDIQSDAPAIKLINTLILEAVRSNASDIHIEPYENHFTVRFRIDGSLTDIVNPPAGLQSSLVSRIKVMAGLDIAEKRLPQDGRIQLKVSNRNVDVRVSVIPTLYGERVVLRLLDKSLKLFDINEVGIDEIFMPSVRKSLSKSNGMILTTGPTGSGKTTTLYSFIHTINNMFPDKNVLTIEDPVEYQIPKISQMHVNSKIGLTFASGLKHILRQDPDIIMVGEIRDSETAEIAVQSALTGHLVFSSLHTNDAASAFTRLIDMGIEPFLVSSSLEIVFAQRLLKLLCNSCKKRVRLSDSEIKTIFHGEVFTESEELPKIKSGEFFGHTDGGCDRCNHTGYKGRTAIYEILEIDDEIRSMIMTKRNSKEIKHKAILNGMSTLRQEAVKLFANGSTSLFELLRITQEDK